MKIRCRTSVVLTLCCSVLVIGASACSSRAEPSCKDPTAIETLRENIEQNLLATRGFGKDIRVTKVEGSPVERTQFGLVCRALVEITNVDVSEMAGVDKAKQVTLVKQLQINQSFTVDLIEGEVVTRANLANLFFVVGTAATIAAARESGAVIPGHSR